MNLLTAAEKAFVQENVTADVQALLLKKYPASVDIRKLVNQVAARQKARNKLPAWYAHEDLIFPPALSVEQASSERTAQHKASLVQGQLLIDLTGGMGVDSWAFAQRMERVIYVERQPALAALAAYNLPLLGCTNVTVLEGDGVAMLERLLTAAATQPADWLYLDPHRRDGQGGRVVKLDDCEPDLTQAGVVAGLLNYTRRILVKVSPLLDIDKAVQQLTGRVESVYIVAVLGEVKELLFVIGNQCS